jgi:hypothetical protein
MSGGSGSREVNASYEDQRIGMGQAKGDEQRCEGSIEAAVP